MLCSFKAPPGLYALLIFNEASPRPAPDRHQTAASQTPKQIGPTVLQEKSVIGARFPTPVDSDNPQTKKQPGETNHLRGVQCFGVGSSIESRSQEALGEENEVGDGSVWSPSVSFP